jgi:hypothetical protein
MRQSLGVDRDVALDAGDLLARCIGVLHALHVNDQRAGSEAASLFGTVLAN